MLQIKTELDWVQDITFDDAEKFVHLFLATGVKVLFKNAWRIVVYQRHHIDRQRTPSWTHLEVKQYRRKFFHPLRPDYVKEVRGGRKSPILILTGKMYQNIRVVEQGINYVDIGLHGAENITKGKVHTFGRKYMKTTPPKSRKRGRPRKTWWKGVPPRPFLGFNLNEFREIFKIIWTKIFEENQNLVLESVKPPSIRITLD